MSSGEATPTLLFSGVEAASQSLGLDKTNAGRVATAVELITSLGTGGADDLVSATAKYTNAGLSSAEAAAKAAVHARRFVAVQGGITAGGAAVGAAYGYSQNGLDGALDGALTGAHIASMAGGLVAAATVKCFVAGTLVWIPAEDVTTASMLVAFSSSERDRHGLDTTSSIGLILIASAGLGALLLDNFALASEKRHKRKTNSRDAWFEEDEEHWFRERFGIEELSNDGKRFCLN
ncbi:MAG: hypothetical protein U0892_02855 [Pirellulales bacterium]